MRYAVSIEWEDCVFVVDAPRDDLSAILDGVVALGGWPYCGDENDYYQAIQDYSEENDVSFEEAEELCSDMGYQLCNGYSLFEDSVFFTPYPPNTKVGRYPYQRTWKPDYEIFREARR